LAALTTLLFRRASAALGKHAQGGIGTSEMEENCPAEVVKVLHLPLHISRTILAQLNAETHTRYWASMWEAAG
jgi:hypothetical protein